MSRDRDEIDIKMLLAEALADEPSTDLTEPVLARLAGVKTAVELGRLLGLAPFGWARAGDDDNDDNDVEHQVDDLISEDDDDDQA